MGSLPTRRDTTGLPHGSISLADFCEQIYLPTLAEMAAINERRHSRAAINHLTRFLNRPPRVDDLTTKMLFKLCAWMLEENDRARGTCDRYRTTLTRIARAAVAQGLLDSVPRGRRLRPRYRGVRTTPPWPADELDRLYGSACTMPQFDETPEALFWPALILAILDTQASAPALMMLRPAAFNPQAATLCVGLFIYRLRPPTVEALEALNAAADPDRERLFPWHADAGRPPFCMLYYRYRVLLERADLPKREEDLFERLRATAAAVPDVVQAIDRSRPFKPQMWTVRQRRADQAALSRARRIAASQVAPTGFPKSHAKTRKRGDPAPVVYCIAPLPALAARTIRSFFENVYVPRRLADGAADTTIAYRSAINRLCDFAGCEVLLDQLSDDLIERLLTWLAKRKMAAFTRKRIRGELLCIWRFAARKRDPATRKPFVAEPPLDIERVKTPKIEPEAWSIDEVSRLLAVAEAVEETVCSIPAGLFWSGLILTIYDTGLRVGALMKLRSADLDLAGRFVKARFGTQKQLADQSLPISRETADRLAQIHPERRELLFPWPFSTSTTLTNRLRLLLQRAGLPCTKKDLFHKLRRTNGTYIADIAGEEAAMRQLGHSTLQVTRKYIDRRKLSAPRLVDQMQRPKSVHGAPDPQPAIAGRPVPRLTCEPPPADVDQPREAS